MASAADISLREAIARIDERTLTLLKSHDQLRTKLDEHREALDGHIDNVYSDVEKHYAKKADFDPVRKLVFGFVGFMLLSIGGMFIGLIVKSNTSAHEAPVISKVLPPSIIK